MKDFWRRHPYLALVYLFALFIPCLVGELWGPFKEFCETFCRAIYVVVQFIRTGKEVSL